MLTDHLDYVHGLVIAPFFYPLFRQEISAFRTSVWTVVSREYQPGDVVEILLPSGEWERVTISHFRVYLPFISKPGVYVTHANGETERILFSNWKVMRKRRRKKIQTRDE